MSCDKYGKNCKKRESINQNCKWHKGTKSKWDPLNVFQEKRGCYADK